MKQLAERSLGDELLQVQRTAKIFSNNVLTPYPFQANLHGLPPQVVAECLWGIVEAHMQRGAAEPRNFEEYIHHHFGRGIAEHFMVPYNTKLWGVEPREITSAWCQRFVPRPQLRQVIEGAVGAELTELGYNVSFRYPRQGGIETFTRALIEQIPPDRVQLDATVEGIDTTRSRVIVGDDALDYHSIIVSMPLPQIVAAIKEPPDTIVEAASRLRATAVRYLNVATRVPATADYHWVYVPSPKLPFYRVGVFSNAMPQMAPAGCSSLYVELSDRGPISDREAVIADALAALVEIGAIGSTEDVLFADLREIDPAYVVFDEAYEEATTTIHQYLQQQRIHATGRYGAWIYNSMEDSLLMGRDAAAWADGIDGAKSAGHTQDQQ